MQTCNFHPQHDDIIHDLSYNYYGKRICSASADQYLKVWDMTTGAVVDKDGNEQQHNWELSDSWKVSRCFLTTFLYFQIQAHEAAVLKCCWAHPEFGNVIASCSFDRSIRVWEEVTSAADKNSSNGSGQKWSEVARLVDSRGTVQDIEFAPNHMGLKLATVSVDGALRIYEAMDVINLSHWTLMVRIRYFEG